MPNVPYLGGIWAHLGGNSGARAPDRWLIGSLTGSDFSNVGNWLVGDSHVIDDVVSRMRADGPANRGVKFAIQIKSDWPQMGQIWDFSDQFQYILALTNLSSKLGQIGPKWDKSGIFSDQIQ